MQGDEPPARPLIVGLTGGIGSGKSVVSEAFERLGAAVIDTDRIARELVEPGQPALDEIIRAFGRDCLAEDGSLDRRRLRQEIFEHDVARRQLESILHPRIRACVRERVAALDVPYCIVVVPLLVESGMLETVDRVLVVDVAPETQIRRVMARDSIPQSLARRILATQSDRATRLDSADDVIDNSGDIERVARAVAALDRKYRSDGRPCGPKRDPRE